jgi:hypothetical protein
VFGNDNGYYSASFKEDADIDDYYCISFYSGIKQQAEINITGYNEVPLNIHVRGKCTNPEIFLYRKSDNELVKRFQVFVEIDQDHYLEINSGILNSGVWEVDVHTGEREDLTEVINYAYGSPYFYLENGDYYVLVQDINNNNCLTDISWQEEYSE